MKKTDALIAQLRAVVAEHVRKAERSARRIADAECREQTARWREALATAQAKIAALQAGGSNPLPADPSVPGGYAKPWTHQHRGISATAAKDLLPPRQVTARVAPRGESRGRRELTVGADITISDTLFTGPGAGYEKQILSLFHANPNGAPGAMLLENVGFDLAEDAPTANLLWFARLYNLARFKCIGSDFRGTFRNGRQSPMEHALYFNVAGDTLVEDCTFRDLGGKGVYDAFRDLPYAQSPPDNVPLAARPRRIMRGCRIVDCGQDARKGSFPDTVFDGGTPEFPGTVLRSNNVIVSAWDFERSQGNNDRKPVADTTLWNPVRAGGAFMHNSFQHQDGFGLDLYRRENELIHLTQANHPIGVVRNARRVEFSGLCVETVDHRNPYIDVNSAPGKLQEQQKYSETVVMEDGVSASGAQYRIYHDDGTYALFPVDDPGRRVEYDVRTRKATVSTLA